MLGYDHMGGLPGDVLTGKAKRNRSVRCRTNREITWLGCVVQQCEVKPHGHVSDQNTERACCWNKMSLSLLPFLHEITEGELTNKVVAILVRYELVGEEGQFY